MSKLPVIGRQLDRCDICGKKVHKIDLVRTNVDFLSPSGRNYITYSSYNSSGWSYDTMSVSSNTSIGCYADRSRVSISDDNTRTGILGPTTWDGAGTLRTSSSINVVNPIVFTKFVFSADVGPYERETSPEMTFTIGICSNDGSVKSEQASFTTSGSQRIWFAMNVADVPYGYDVGALYFYISTDSTNDWWADRMQVERDVSRPGTFIPTSGSSVDQTDARAMTMRKVCKSCREPLTSRTNQYNREPEQRTDEPVSVWTQEV